LKKDEDLRETSLGARATMTKPTVAGNAYRWAHPAIEQMVLTKDGQSTSSVGSTLTWSLISSGACIRASLKILRLPLFSPQVSPAAPTAVAVLL
jgi:hypothetical protein